MKRLSGKHILLGITGGIAAYKAADLARRLREHGAEVRVVMTNGAKEFITPLTLQAVSGNPIHDDLLDTAAEAAMGHIELARWADAAVIAPASADSIARLAQGRADDLLTTLCLATPATILVAPAMNQQMWRDAATQQNIANLQQQGKIILGPAEGEQACGDVGPGRMLEPNDIAIAVAEQFQHQALTGKRVLITAGPTQEAIDPVRYLSNHSSGKMGFALATAAVEAGALVTLIAGPVAEQTPERVTRIDVVSAQQMLDNVIDNISGQDIFISVAAVADYRVAEVATHKIKKSADEMTLSFVKNPDILTEVCQRGDKPFVVGFAAETDNLIEHAKDKLIRKGCDMIVANDVAKQAQGFGSDDNAVTVVTTDAIQDIPLANKQQIARTLIETIAKAIKES